jgi:Glycosyltransferase family 17
MAFTSAKRTHAAIAFTVMYATLSLAIVNHSIIWYYFVEPTQMLQNHRGMDFHLGFESDVTARRGATFEVTDPHGDEIDVGVLSTRDPSFFRALETEIDEVDHTTRCARYRATYNTTHPTSRRIFYGSLVADEPWEVMEIVAAESYGIYQGMVFVEGNRTQNFTPRPFRRLHHGPTLANLFGVPKSHVHVRAFVNEDPKLTELSREHAQRAEIVRGWKELGMQPDDVGLLADADETFSRDFLRAVQVCDGIDLLDYESHHCKHTKVKLVAVSRVFESSPECVTDKRTWYHPDMIIGHCIDGISNSPKHGPAPRTKGSYLRAPGFGVGCDDWEGEGNITDSRYPLWNAADFRRTCGGVLFPLFNRGTQTQQRLDLYTGFHFHNFFAQFNDTRFKYLTFGHADKKAGVKPIEKLSPDLKLMYRCVNNLPEDPEQKYKRVAGGFDGIDPFLPIYFQDDDYRRRRHAYVQEMVEADERFMETLQ